MSEALSLDPETLDPRVRRTRSMLQAGLASLLQSRSFEKISVGDITEAAALNRATFYDHYTDKFELFEGLVRSRFADLLAERGVFFDGECTSALTGIALGACDYLAGTPGIDCPGHYQSQGHLEAAIIAVIRGMILEGIRRHPPPTGISPEIAAAAVSGAIYAAAREWVRTPGRPPAEAIVGTITRLVTPMLAA